MRVELQGRANLEARLRGVASNIDLNVQSAVYDAGEDLLMRSQRITPVAAPDGGQLRASGYVDHSIPGTAEVGYTARYALYVHEMGITVYPERSPITWTTPGTHAKFLERPAVENRHRYVKSIGDAVKRGIEYG